MSPFPTDAGQVQELLLQALETELGGLRIYQAAIDATVREDLREEWQGYLAETEGHRDVLIGVLRSLSIDPDRQTPGRAIVGHIGQALEAAIRMAIDAGDPAAAERVAAECVCLAETKDHANWELIGRLGKAGADDAAELLKAAYDRVEKDEDHHLYHSKGWARELWIQALGLPAALPPPEETLHVQTAIGAARAMAMREELM